MKIDVTVDFLYKCLDFESEKVIFNNRIEYWSQVLSLPTQNILDLEVNLDYLYLPELEILDFSVIKQYWPLAKDTKEAQWFMARFLGQN